MKQPKLLTALLALLLLIGLMGFTPLQPVEASGKGAPLPATTTVEVIKMPTNGLGRWALDSATTGWQLRSYNDSSWSTHVGTGWYAGWDSYYYVPEIGKTAAGYGTNDLEYHHRNWFNISIPAGYAIADGRLQMLIDDDATVYVNEDLLVTRGVAGQYTIPAGSLRSGSNLIAVDLNNYGSISGLHYRITVTFASIDTTPPTPSASQSPAAGWQKGPVTVTASASDPSGVANIYCRKAGGTWSSGVISCQQGFVTNGAFEYYAIDTVGNQSTTRTHTVSNIDSTPPTITATKSAPDGLNSFHKTDATVTLSASDGQSGVKAIYYRIFYTGYIMDPEMPFTQALGSTKMLSLDKSFSVEYYAEDNVGRASATQTIYGSIDKQAPTITVTYPDVDESGWYKGGATLAVKALDTPTVMMGGSGIASGSLEYRLNGGVWADVPVDGNSYPPKAALTIDQAGTNTVEFRVSDGAGNRTTLPAETVKIDLEMPAAVYTFNPSVPNGENDYYVTDVTVTLSGSDGNSGVKGVYYRVIYSTYDTPFDLPFTEVLGSTTSISFDRKADRIEWYVLDNAGRKTVGENLRVRMDKNAPVINTTFPAPSESGWYGRPVRIDVSNNEHLPGGSGTKSGSMQYRLNGGEWMEVSYESMAFPPRGYVDLPAESGDYAVEFRATDGAGNTGVKAAQTFRIDTLAPGVTPTLAPASPNGQDGWYITAPTLTLTATDSNAGVQQLFYRVDPIVNPDLAAPFIAVDGDQVEITVSGPSTIVYYAVDQAGNTSAEASQDLYVDDQAPMLAVTAPDDAEGGWFTTGVDIEASATDNEPYPTVEYRVNGGDWQPVAGRLVLEESGVFVLDVRAVDAAGNTVSYSRTFSLDLLAPVLSANVPSADGRDGWFVTAPTVELAASDAHSGVSKLYYQVVKLGASEPTPPFMESEEGSLALAITESVTLTWYAVDEAGNRTENQSVTVKVDTIQPTISLSPFAPANANGWHNQAVNVIANITDGPAYPSGIAATQYRENGGSWSNLIGPAHFISTPGVNTYEVRAVDEAGNETITSLIVRIDTQAPALSRSLPPADGADGWYLRSPVAVSLTAGDPVAGIDYMRYRVRETGNPALPAWTTVNGATAQVSMTQEGTLEWEAYDLAGNKTAESFPVNIDESDPVVTITLPALPASGWFTGFEVPLTVDAQDGDHALSVEYRLNGGGWQAYGDEILISENGVHTVEVRATDLSGRAATASASVKIDSVAPLVDSTMLPMLPDGENGWYVTSPVNLFLESSDGGSGVAALYYRVGGGEFSLVNTGDKLLSLANGVHLVEWKAVDVAGNESPVLTRTVKVDLTAPEITVTRPPADQGNWYYSKPVTVSAGALDAESASTLEYSLDGGAWAAFPGTIDVTEEGQHTLAFRAINLAGLMGTEEIAVWIDTLAPDVVVVILPGANEEGWYNDEVTLPGLSDLPGSSDIVKIRYRVLPEGAWSETPPAFDESGEYQVEVELTDAAGHVTTQTITVKVDVGQPEIELELPMPGGENGWYTSLPLSFTPAVSDDLSKVKSFTCSVDGGAALPAAEIRIETAGEHAIACRAEDHAGNITTVTETLRVDTTPPALTLTVPTPDGENGWFVTRPVMIQVSAVDLEGDVMLAYQVDGGEWAALIGDLPLDLEGEHTVVIRATNEAGLVSTETVELKVDTIPPSTDDVLPEDPDGDGWVGGGDEDSVTLPGQNNLPVGIVKIEYQLSDGTWTETPPMLGETGDYTIQIRITDEAGNVTSATITISLDLDAPVIETNPTGDGNRVKGVVDFSGKVTDAHSGVGSAGYSLDSGASWTALTLADDGSFAFTWDTRTQANGHHTVQVRAVDRVGNETVTTIGLDIDNRLFIFMPVVAR